MTGEGSGYFLARHLRLLDVKDQCLPEEIRELLFQLKRSKMSAAMVSSD